MAKRCLHDRVCIQKLNMNVSHLLDSRGLPYNVEQDSTYFSPNYNEGLCSLKGVIECMQCSSGEEFFAISNIFTAGFRCFSFSSVFIEKIHIQIVCKKNTIN